MDKIGFFGGSFDPIHIAHINLALQIKEKYLLDKVIFCPANISPFKVNFPPVVGGSDRYKMVSLAIEGIEDFLITDFEIKKKSPSYTINTLKHLINEHSSAKFFLILYKDLICEFNKWKDFRELLKISKILVAVDEGDKNEKINKNLIDFIPQVCSIKKIDINSTFIRDRIKKNLYCGHILHPKVLDYIYKHRLYS